MQITLHEEDCQWLEETSQETGSYTEEQLAVALAAKRITLDQCMYMHDNHINWQIDVERKCFWQC